MELPKGALEHSALVVAHPDDEVLWFGSILERVDRIIICYIEASHRPELNEARRKSIAEHQLRDRIDVLDLAQVKSHNKCSWPEPEETSYGVRLDRYRGFDEPYRKQAQRLEEALAPVIRGFRNVYTHNPWGEYGHEDHIQLSRIVTRLATSSGARVWYNSYVSNKSSLLMRRYVQGFGQPYYTLPVDTTKAREFADTYYRNGAWTWMEDYAWFNSESFVEGPLVAESQPCKGALFPLNFIRVPFEPIAAGASKSSLAGRLRRKLGSVVRISRHRETNPATR